MTSNRSSTWCCSSFSGSSRGTKRLRPWREGKDLIMLSGWSKYCPLRATDQKFQVSCWSKRPSKQFPLHFYIRPYSKSVSLFNPCPNLIRIECILNCYRHVRELDFDEDPNYELLKSLVLHDLSQATSPSSIGIFDWSRPSIHDQTL